MNHKKRVFLDMDGVLVEWQNFKYTITGFESCQNVQERIMQKLYEKHYFYTLPPQQFVIEAVKKLIRQAAVQMPFTEFFILSASLSSETTADKNKWLNRYLPEIPADHRIFVPNGANKKLFVPGGVTVNDYLLDDYTKNLLEWEPGTGIKLLNGQNHTNGTWKGASVRYDAQDLSEKLWAILTGIPVQDTQPDYIEHLIPIRVVSANFFTEEEKYEEEYNLLVDQYKKILLDPEFRVLEWQDEIGRHIFHPSTKNEDWQLTYIDKNGVPIMDIQFRTENIGNGRNFQDPILEFPYSTPKQGMVVRTLFANSKKKRNDKKESSGLR